MSFNTFIWFLYFNKATIEKKNVYTVRITNDEDSPVLYFVADEPSLDLRSSVRKDFTEYYKKHIGDMNTNQQGHISSKMIFKTKMIIND